MIKKCHKVLNWFLLVLSALILLGCTAIPGQDANPLPTATPTMSGDMLKGRNPCEDLSGRLEMQILVGPSEAVGMEPLALGEIPFTVVTKGDPYSIEGGGPLNFEPQVFAAEWGSYTVYFDADTEISGLCVSSDDEEMLDMIVTMRGEQLVEVVYEGIQMDYPWSGTNELPVIFPIEEGAQQEGEGWLLILHLDQ